MNIRISIAGCISLEFFLGNSTCKVADSLVLEFFLELERHLILDLVGVPTLLFGKGSNGDLDDGITPLCEPGDNSFAALVVGQAFLLFIRKHVSFLKASHHPLCCLLELGQLDRLLVLSGC